MERFEALEDRVDDLAERMSHVERNYKDLRETQDNMREAQIRLETYVRESFRRSEEQDQRQFDAIKKLDTRYELMEQSNEKRHADMVQHVNEGVKEALNAVGTTNPVWVTGMIATLVGVGGILLGVGATIAIGKHWL